MKRMIENKKVSIILVLKVLEEYSDEDHYLTHQQIIDKINSQYGMELERKSVASSITLLQELDYDIVKGEKGGFALLSRTFDSSEVTFLVDAIFSSKSISGKQAKQLSDKVSSCLSKYQRKSYDYLNKSAEVSRTANKQVFLNIDIINEAIRRNKWIGFKYQDFDKDGKPSLRFGGYVFHCSPCYLINNFGRYYFLGFYNKYQSVNTYRLDYMQDVYVMEERERLDPSTLDEFKNYNSISDYINDHIYMFGGETIEVVMQLMQPKVIQYIYDWFGQGAKIYKEDNKLMARIKCNRIAFFYWVMQYGEHLHMISPQDMIDWVKEAANAILKQYEEKNN